MFHSAIKTLSWFLQMFRKGLQTSIEFFTNGFNVFSIFGNPFAKENLSKKLQEKVGESIEQLGEDIKGKIKK